MPVGSSGHMMQEAGQSPVFYSPKHAATTGPAVVAAGSRRGSKLTSADSDDSADDAFSSEDGDESESETVRCKRSVASP